MKKITIGFSSHEYNLLSWAIRTVENTPYSHVYIKVHSDSLDRDIIYQASGLAVNFVGTKIFEEKAIIIKEFELDVSDETYLTVIRFAIDQAGKPYGLLDLLGFLYMKAGRAMGFNTHNPIRDGEQSYVCSELVATIIAEFIDKNVEKKEPLEDITPRGLYEYLSDLIKQ